MALLLKFKNFRVLKADDSVNSFICSGLDRLPETSSLLRNRRPSSDLAAIGFIWRFEKEQFAAQSVYKFVKKLD